MLRTGCNYEGHLHAKYGHPIHFSSEAGHDPLPDPNFLSGSGSEIKRDSVSITDQVIGIQIRSSAMIRLG